MSRRSRYQEAARLLDQWMNKNVSDLTILEEMNQLCDEITLSYNIPRSQPNTRSPGEIALDEAWDKNRERKEY